MSESHASHAPRFIHLRLHTEYSISDGIVQVDAAIARAAADGMPALGISDLANLFGMVKFYKGARGKGIKPVIGADCWIANPVDRDKPSRVLLICKSRKGYGQLCELLTRAFMENKYRGRAEIVRDWLSAETASDLLCLSGARDGDIGHALANGNTQLAETFAADWARRFPDGFYIELQRAGHPGTETYIREAVQIAARLNLPVVATHPIQFTRPEDFKAHEARVCISQGYVLSDKRRPKDFTDQQYFKSQDEMAALFADLPEALENSVEIARRCSLTVQLGKNFLPQFPTPEGMTLDDFLIAEARKGLEERLVELYPNAEVREQKRPEYEARLKFETDTIVQMGFPGYFLIVADFINWAKQNGVPVGPGRGSGAGSLVAYSLRITDLDPLAYALLFERFLNPERVSMPDFDIDFCMDRREEVITYVQDRYGRDKVGQIITFGALLSKAAVRDVGRVLQMPYGQVDRLSKMIPLEGVKPVSITKALADEPRLREAAKEEVVGRLLNYAEQIEGLYRNASTHAAGVVIGDRPLDELVPLYQDPRSDMPATQFNMKWVEAAGLVKFDFLGLKTLTVIQNALDLLALRGVSFDINLIPLDDKPTYELYAAAKTVAVFQVESSGMMDALRRMKPTCIEDIVALVALYRPGPMENIPVYCEVKNGQRDLESIHPTIDHILAETQGIIVYQEQVMQIAQVMGGYSLGGADLLRRAMGKKIAEEMAKERPKFIEGAKATHGIDAKKSGEVFDLLEKFANYGFNKSHAAAYAVVSYQTAYLKANYPVEFMAAVMNCDIHLTDKLAVYKREVDKLGIKTVAPCVNRSLATFTVVDGQVVYALGALKNVGVDAMGLIVEARKTEGGGDKPFATLFDVARRVDLKRVGKRPLEMLARAGAFDTLDANRARVFEALDGLVAYSAAIHEAKASNQVSLFGEAGTDIPEPRIANRDDWLPVERLGHEHQAIGFYLSGHPLDDYMAPLKRRNVMTLTELTAKAERGPLVAKLAGSVSSRQERKSAKGNRFAFVQLSDPTGLYEVTVFSDTLEAAREHLEPGKNVVLTVEANLEGDTLKLLCRGAQPIDQVAAEGGAQALRIHLNKAEAAASVAALFGRVEGKNRAQITICVPDEQGREIDLTLPQPYPITPQIKGAIKAMSGVVLVEEV